MNRSPCPSRPRGMALSVVMILLLLMCLLGLAAMRSTAMQERMSASVRDRSLAFEAAEAALREGEQVAASRAEAPDVIDCRSAACDPTPSDAAWAEAATATTAVEGTAAPQYVVELLADDVPSSGGCTTSVDISESACTSKERRYRITARSQGDGRATVVLQSTYAVP